jgi:hypothetical protein
VGPEAPRQPAAAGPSSVALSSKLCEQADIETKWFVHWCRGHDIAHVSFETCSELDQFVVLPPFPRPTGEWPSLNVLTLPDAPHLRLVLLGHVSTSIGLIIGNGRSVREIEGR